ncbi:MAG: UPF0149 family protein [FCB group bacterium]|nr:UPF0149 family protein [FCB group bacterium]
MQELILPDIQAPLSDKEMDELGDFLISEKTPESTMDIAMLDGFLTALAIGPNTVLPSQWMPAVWGDEEIVWESMEEAQKILSTIHRLMNQIIYGFDLKPIDFQPIFYESTHTGKRIPIYDEWCMGFVRGMLLSPKEWQSIKDADIEPDPLGPIILFGTKEGWELLEKGPASSVPHEDWEELIHKGIGMVYEYWIPFRKAIHQTKIRTVEPKVGRNEPCPCGSGKKFKHCCLN